MIISMKIIIPPTMASPGYLDEFRALWEVVSEGIRGGGRTISD